MPVNYNRGIDLPLSACGDANTWQYNFVMPSGAGSEKRFLVSNGASGPVPLGVLQDDPQSQNVGAVRVFGSTLIKYDATGSAITYGDFIASGSTGMAIVATASIVQGIALTAIASGASIIGEAFIFPGGWSALADNTP